MTKRIDLRKTAFTAASFILFFGLWWLVWRLAPVPPYLLPSPQAVFDTLFGALTFSIPRHEPLVRRLGQSATTTSWFCLRGHGRRASWHRVRLYPGTFARDGSAPSVIYPIPTFAWISACPYLVRPGRSGDHFHGCHLCVLADLHAGLSGHAPNQYALSLGSQRARCQRTFNRKTGPVSGSLPFLLNGLRLGYGEAWRLLVAAEIILATAGLGHLI